MQCRRRRLSCLRAIRFSISSTSVEHQSNIREASEEHQRSIRGTSAEHQRIRSLVPERQRRIGKVSAARSAGYRQMGLSIRSGLCYQQIGDRTPTIPAAQPSPRAGAVRARWLLACLIPLELGGSPGDSANLWPQSRTGTWTADLTDDLERTLNRRTIEGRLSQSASPSMVR